MNPTFTRRAALGLLAGALPALSLAQAAVQGNLPGDSIYRLQGALTDQDGKPFELSSLRGAPVLASMFYTSCDMVCPMIFETVHATLKALPERERQAVRVLMVSFDPQRDSVPVLRKTAQQRGCDGQWRLARADDALTRKVAAVLGIQYRKLADGEFNHSSTITLLDADGRPAARSGKLGAADPQMLKAVHRTLAA